MMKTQTQSIRKLKALQAEARAKYLAQYTKLQIESLVKHNANYTKLQIDALVKYQAEYSQLESEIQAIRKTRGTVLKEKSLFGF